MIIRLNRDELMEAVLDWAVDKLEAAQDGKVYEGSNFCLVDSAGGGVPEAVGAEIEMNAVDDTDGTLEVR